ncbi:MAG TPA: zf-HC2 domain-containing protein [Planctomycetota bacterium]|nr:zf-HC2 domain-containing protein [Planctomycetota bacterium]
MSCDDIRDLLPLVAGSDAGPEERQAVEAHAALCGRCARELDQLRESRAALASLGEMPAPPSLWPSIRRELFPATPRRFAGWDDLLRLAAALMLGLGAGVAAYPYVRPVPSVEPLAVSPLPRPLAQPATARDFLFAPRARPAADEAYWLPRVEDVFDSPEKEF